MGSCHPSPFTEQDRKINERKEKILKAIENFCKAIGRLDEFKAFTKKEKKHGS